MLTIVVDDADGFDGTDAGGELRVELGVFGNLPDEHVVVGLFCAVEVSLPGVEVLLERVPLVDTLEDADTGVSVELDSHTGTFRRAIHSPADAVWRTRSDRPDPMA